MAKQLFTSLTPRKEIYASYITDKGKERFHPRAKQVIFLMSGPNTNVKAMLRQWLDALKENNTTLDIDDIVLIIFGKDKDHLLDYSEEKWAGLQHTHDACI